MVPHWTHCVFCSLPRGIFRRYGTVGSKVSYSFAALPRVHDYRQRKDFSDEKINRKNIFSVTGGWYSQRFFSGCFHQLTHFRQLIFGSHWTAFETLGRIFWESFWNCADVVSLQDPTVFIYSPFESSCREASEGTSVKHFRQFKIYVDVHFAGNEYLCISKRERDSVDAHLQCW